MTWWRIEAKLAVQLNWHNMLYTAAQNHGLRLDKNQPHIHPVCRQAWRCRFFCFLHSELLLSELSDTTFVMFGLLKCKPFKMKGMFMHQIALNWTREGLFFRQRVVGLLNHNGEIMEGFSHTSRSHYTILICCSVKSEHYWHSIINDGPTYQC